MRTKEEQQELAAKVARLRDKEDMSWVNIAARVGCSDSYACKLYKSHKDDNLESDLFSAITKELNEQVDGDQDAVHKIEVLLGEKTRKIKILVYPGNPETKIGDESKGFEVVVYEPEIGDSTEYKKELDRRTKNKMLWKPVFDANSFDDEEI